MGRSGWVSCMATGCSCLVIGLFLVVTGARADDCVLGPWHARFVFVGINHYLVADHNAERRVAGGGKAHPGSTNSLAPKVTCRFSSRLSLKPMISRF